MLGAIWTYLIPVYVLGGLVLLLLVLNLLARVQGGRYVRPLAQGLMKLPWVGKQLRKASRATLEKQNPDLEAAGEQGPSPEPMNRAQRRAAEKLKKQQRR